MPMPKHLPIYNRFCYFAKSWKRPASSLRRHAAECWSHTINVHVQLVECVVQCQAKESWDKFRKERDYHRMHHRRVGLCGE